MPVIGYSNSAKTADYNISSARGLQFLDGATAGSQMTGGDGSLWTKNADGSTTIKRGSDTWTVGSSLSNLQSNLDRITRTASENSAKSAQMAAEQRDWSANQAQIANQFSAAEAAKNRDWQQYMSNTAHQREVADLKAAGLNPVLSATGGNGAAVTSGASASASLPSGSKGEADTSGNAAIASILGSILSAQMQLETANVSARTQEAVADKYTAMEHLVAQISSAASMRNADVSAAASKYAANQSASATRYAAGLSSAASKYAADASAAASRYHSDKSYEASTYSTEQNFLGGILGDLAPWANTIIDGISLFSNLFGKKNGSSNRSSGFGSNSR